MLVVISLILTVIGCYFLNENGSYTTSGKARLIGYGLNVAGCVLMMLEYGNLRGLFVYLGAVSLIGMIYALSLYKFKTS